jgi:hypothetical protein
MKVSHRYVFLHLHTQSFVFKIFNWCDENERIYLPLDTMDWNTVKVYRFPAGVPTTLYSYKGYSIYFSVTIVPLQMKQLGLWFISSTRNGPLARCVYKKERERVRKEECRELTENEWNQMVTCVFWRVWNHMEKKQGYILPSDTTKVTHCFSKYT